MDRGKLSPRPIQIVAVLTGALLVLGWGVAWFAYSQTPQIFQIPVETSRGIRIEGKWSYLFSPLLIGTAWFAVLVWHAVTWKSFSQKAINEHKDYQAVYPVFRQLHLPSLYVSVVIVSLVMEIFITSIVTSRAINILQ